MATHHGHHHGHHEEAAHHHGHSHAGEDMLSVEEAYERVMASFAPLEGVEVPLLECLGQTLAEDITSLWPCHRWPTPGWTATPCAARTSWGRRRTRQASAGHRHRRRRADAGAGRRGRHGHADNDRRTGTGRSGHSRSPSRKPTRCSASGRPSAGRGGNLHRDARRGQRAPSGRGHSPRTTGAGSWDRGSRRRGWRSGSLGLDRVKVVRRPVVSVWLPATNWRPPVPPCPAAGYTTATASAWRRLWWPAAAFPGCWASPAITWTTFTPSWPPPKAPTW